MGGGGVVQEVVAGVTMKVWHCVPAVQRETNCCEVPITGNLCTVQPNNATIHEILYAFITHYFHLPCDKQLILKPKGREKYGARLS